MGLYVLNWFVQFWVIERIYISHLIIIIKSEILIFPIVVIFSNIGYLRWLYHHMLSVSYISWETWVVFFLLLCSLMIRAYDRVHYSPVVVFVCLHITLPHYHQFADVSEGIRFLIYLSSGFCRVCVNLHCELLHVCLLSQWECWNSFHVLFFGI